MTQEQKLKFSKNNRKLHEVASALELKKSAVVGFDLPAGWTCPSAQDCKSKANRITGKVTDDKNCKYRCYAVSAESAFPNARKMRWHNFDILRNAKTESKMADVIMESLPASAQIVRIHTSGDFFNKAYFQAWIRVAYLRQDIVIYGYTKQAQYLENATVPDNFRIVVSEGGKNNDSAKNHRRVFVVYNENHTMPVYTDVKSELHVMSNQAGNFGLLIHGTQPAGFYNR